MSDRVSFQFNTGRVFLELAKNPDFDHALMLSLTGDAVSGTRETVNMRLDAEKVRALYTGLDLTAPRPLQLPDDVYTGLMDAIGNAVEYSDVLDDEAMDADDMESQDKYHQQAADFRELRDRLKVLTGHAKNFDDHFTVIRDSSGEPVEPDYPKGREVPDAALHHVWTVMDCDGELCISPGFHWVNRLNHIMTTEAWSDDDQNTEWIY